MKPIAILLVVFAMCTGLVNQSSMAQSKPIQLSLFPPVQIFPENTSIGGLRLTLLYGKNVSVMGVDLALIAAHNTGGHTKGVQWAIVGINDGMFTGLQSCGVSLTNAKVTGVQFGLYNYAEQMSGLQVGIVNSGGSMYGLQIGLVNLIKTNGMFPIFPIVNWSF